MIVPSIKTLDESALRREVKTLYLQVIESGYLPTHVVGIATGGAYMSAILRSLVVTRPDGPTFLNVKCQRLSTHQKQKLKLNRVLRHLPYSITNPMRIIEHLARQRHGVVEANSSEIAVLESTDTAAIDYSTFKKVLILDDAADTGETLAKVEDYLKSRCNSDTQIRAAVLSKTNSRLVRNPDYQVFEGVLLRFPWSFDFHG